MPKEFRFSGSEVYVKRQGNALLLVPEEEPWETLVESTTHFSDDFMAERRQPILQTREGLSE